MADDINSGHVKKIVGLVVPYVVFNSKRLWMDSGFLTLYELCKEIHKQVGWYFYFYLNINSKPHFESENDPKITGIYPVYSLDRGDNSVAITRSIDDAFITKIVRGEYPTDFVITNNNVIIQHLAATVTLLAEVSTPIIYVPLNAGKDNCTNPESMESRLLQTGKMYNSSRVHLLQEALAYISAHSVVWTQEDQKRRGVGIAKRFFNNIVLKNIIEKAEIIGNGLPDFLKKYARGDEEVKRFLQSPKDNYFVSFLGRNAANKNTEFIFDTMYPLFAQHGIRLALNLNTTKKFNQGIKFKDNDTFHNILVTDINSNFIKSREEYSSKKLLSIQCLFYASHAEGHNATVREAVYMGAPVIVPDKSWARACFGEDYPFYFQTKNEAYALALRIGKGKISDNEAAKFIDVRNSKYISLFISDTAQLYITLILRLVKERVAGAVNRQLSIFFDAFEKSIKIGEELDMLTMIERFDNNGLNLRRGCKNGRWISTSECYFLLRDNVEVVDPENSIVRRIK